MTHSRTTEVENRQDLIDDGLLREFGFHLFRAPRKQIGPIWVLEAKFIGNLV